MNKLLTLSKPFYTITRLVNTQSKASPKELLHISDSCVKRLREIGDGNNLRIVVEGGGCAGFQYKFELDDKINEEDRVFEKDNVKIVIDPTSLEYINGSTVDYEELLIRSAFKITKNPLAEDACSCGASFSIKID